MAQGHCDELARREFQADAEHDQDDTQVRQFSRQIGVGGKTGRIGADQDARQQIAHDRRNSQLMGEEAQGECRDDTADHNRYERIRFDHEPIQSSRQPRRTVRETTEKSNDQGVMPRPFRK